MLFALLALFALSEAVLSVIVASTLAPLVLLLANGWVTGRAKQAEFDQRQEEKRIDNERLDQVAATAKEAAEAAKEAAAAAVVQRNLVALQAQEAADLLLKSNTRAHVAAVKVQNSVDGVHLLVNSQMTAQKEDQLIDKTAMLTVMESNLMLSEQAGKSEGTERIKKAIGIIQSQIKKLEADLASRHAADEAAAALAKAAELKAVEVAATGDTPTPVLST